MGVATALGYHKPWERYEAGTVAALGLASFDRFT